MRKLLLILSLLGAFEAFTQPIQFETTCTIPSNTGANYASDILELADSGFFVVSSYGVWSSQDMWLTRMDKMGNVLWIKRYHNTIWTRSGRIHPAGNNEYFLVNAPSIMKIDSSGNLIWNKRYSVPNTWSLSDTTRTGGLILAGSYSWSWGGNGGEIELFKIDGNGNLLWSKTTDGGNKFVNDLVTVPGSEGEFYVISGQHEFGDVISCVDENGNTLWNNSYGTFAAPVALSADSCIYITYPAEDSLTTTHGFRVLKIEMNGTVKFSRGFTTSGSFMATRISTRDTLIQLVGTNGDSSTVVHMVIDSSMNILWTSEVAIPGHFLEVTDGNAICRDHGSVMCIKAADASSNPYMIIHRTNFTGSGGCNEHSVTMLTESRGVPAWPDSIQGNFTVTVGIDTTLITTDTITVIPQCAVGIEPVIASEVSSMLFPNPADDFVTIITIKNSPEVNLRIVNAIGETVLLKSGHTIVSPIDCSALKSGCYFIYVNDVPICQPLIIVHREN